MQGLSGKVVIVTGAGGGLGRAHALMLARYGAKLVINDVGCNKDGSEAGQAAAEQLAAEIRKGGGEAIANTSDVSDWAAAKALIDQAVEQFGGLDVLINNAGILRDTMLWNMCEADFDDVLRVNLKGSYAPLHHAAVYWRQLHKQTGEPLNARVINTTSSSGLFGNVGQSNYSPAKAGVAALTVTAAMELKRMGVTVNAVAPRAETRMTSGLGNWTEAELKQRDPNHVARLVCWLASGEASDITGRFFEAWGKGYSVLEGTSHGAMCAADTAEERLGLEIKRIVAESAQPAHFNRGEYWGL